MLVLVLFSVVSLAAAQCGTSCTCGNSACCQNTDSPASPYNIFNFGYAQQYSYPQQFGVNQQYGGSGNQKTSCIKVNSVPIPLTQVYQNQPVFTRVVVNSDDNRQIDNICSTLFPLPDDSSSYLVYDSTVYCDGSNTVVTTIGTDVGIGRYMRGNAISSFTQVVFASLGNNLFVGCSHNAYGERSSLDVFVTSLGSVSPLGGGCVQQIQNIIQCVGQDEGGLYVLPYRLPTRCVTQQVCSLTNPLHYRTYQYPQGGFNNACPNGRC